MSKGIYKIGGDRVIWFVVILLSILSLLAVYSSTGTLAFKNQGGDISHYIINHAIMLAVGFILLYIAHLFPSYVYPRFFQLFYFVAVILLLATIIYGLNLNSAKRSLPLPHNLSFQTFELAKLMAIGFLARVLFKNKAGFTDFKSVFLKLYLPIAVVCALIVPANLSTAVLLFVTGLVIMFVGRIKIKYLIYIILITITAFAMFIGILFLMPTNKQGRLQTWKSRIEKYNKPAPDPHEVSQVKQSKIAIATGGFFGKLPGNSTQRNFLPHPYSDFIYAIIVEEYGLIGGIAVLLLYLIILYRSFRIALKTKYSFGAYFAVGLSFLLVFQALINMAVAVNLLPVTGQPLPMVSMGGTSVIITGISLGILLSISKDIDKTPEIDTLITTDE